ncbi:MAG: DUF5050 domain-containing protein [Clostridium sp.]|uniref:DUF5050 domain-containing protein n=1 Tax=Clostridium sp. TaxID=1506 RepID=UPI003F2E70C5
MKKFFPLIFISVFLLIGCEKNQTTSKPNPDTTTSTKPSEDDFHRSFGNTINNSINTKHDSYSFVAEYNDMFYSSTSNIPGVFRQGGNPSTSEKLNSDPAKSLNVYKDKLYYCSDRDLIRVDLDGVSNKEVLATSVNDIIISNDALFYVTSFPSKNDSGFSDFQLNKYDLKENKLISSSPVATRLFSFIDENRSIIGSRELFSYVSINKERVFPVENKQNIITFLGQTEDSIICEVYDFSKNTFLQIKDNGNTKVLNLPSESSYLVSKNKVFYLNSKGLSYLDLLTGETKAIHSTKMSENNHLFEFDNILYYSDYGEIKKMYDLEKNTLYGDFAPPVTSLDENSKPDEKPEPKPEPKPKVGISNEDLARELILKADKSNIKKSEAEGAELYPLSDDSEKWTTLAKSWNIKLKGKVLSFELSEDFMINQYLVEMDTKRVYKIPNQGMMPAYLMENDKKVEKFEYNQ